MTIRTITRLFDTRDHALAAVRELETAGFPPEDVGILASNAASNADGQHATTTSSGTPPGLDPALARNDDHHAEQSTKSGAGIGATLGTMVGGGAGLAAGLGALAIPGIGPIVAAGALVAALAGAGAGAAAGGLLGSLTGAGVSEEHAPVYAEGVRRGGSMVVVRADESRATQVETILNRHGPVDVDARAAEYRAGGWEGYREEPLADRRIL
ncbi:hypothetical protein NON00_07160 [Roseomonas sp. GC11]|uniref:hypothetical protein n=1 Tax=Roseomonas sp. GC11 TaxID=2950546 RepID=UPI002108F4E4|nr:hypothetical protein [Roseomonas sp. GC11]MCQ4159703.1 hypothetical protein [Roseomonas sp. GC11]